MKIKYLKLKNRLLVSLAGLLGLQLGCGKEPKDMYGCPCIGYNVKGSVVNEERQPIPGIGVGSRDMSTSENRVVMPGIEYHDTTDAEGRFDVTFFDFPDVSSVKVDFWDIDGELNGSYEHQDVNVSFQDVEFYNQTGIREIQVTLQRANE